MSESLQPMDYMVHGILQARILEWVAFPFFRASSQPRDQTQVSCIAGRFFTSWATREAQECWSGQLIPSPADLPNPGINLGSPASHADSLPAELPGKPKMFSTWMHRCWSIFFCFLFMLDSNSVRSKATVHIVDSRAKSEPTSLPGLLCTEL